MSKHTPGPWKFTEHSPSKVYGNYITVEAESNPSTPLARVYGSWWPGEGRERRDANARLIAAAPDLLKAANDLLAFESTDPDDGLDGEAYSIAWDNLKRAAEKAEGREA